jgi:hypothetical protein
MKFAFRRTSIRVIRGMKNSPNCSGEEKRTAMTLQHRKGSITTMLATGRPVSTQAVECVAFNQYFNVYPERLDTTLAPFF